MDSNKEAPYTLKSCATGSMNFSQDKGRLTEILC